MFMATYISLINLTNDGVIGCLIRRASMSLALALVMVGAEVSWAGAQGRVIYMAAVEMKGGAQQEKEPYPKVPLPSGEGYIKIPANPAGRWEVSAYQWSPGTIVVQQGETVTLEIAGINGDVHPSTIPGVVDSFT